MFMNVNNFYNVKVVHLTSGSLFESFENFVKFCLNFKILSLFLLLIFNIFCRFSSPQFEFYNNNNFKNLTFILNKNKCL